MPCQKRQMGGNCSVQSGIFDFCYYVFSLHVGKYGQSDHECSYKMPVLLDLRLFVQ